MILRSYNRYPRLRDGGLDYLEIISMCQRYNIPLIYLDELSVLEFRTLLTKSMLNYKVNLENQRFITEMAIYNMFSAKTVEDRKVLFPELFPDKKGSNNSPKKHSEDYIQEQKNKLKSKFKY